jgi:hypothetical protein
MSQTVKGSIVEAWANIVVGWWINYGMNALVLGPMLHIHIPWQANVTYGIIMTGVSLVRSFGMRRLFNRIHFGNVDAAKA